MPEVRHGAGAGRPAPRRRASSTRARCIPEIVRDEPGACPICGMALEPRTVDGRRRAQPRTAGHDAALLGRRSCSGCRCSCWRWATCCSAWASAAASACALANWIGLVCATPVVLWAGWPFFERGWASIVNRHTNMFTLIALGVGAAYVYSVAATLVPGIFPEGFRVHGIVEPYFDTAVVVTALVLLGQVLELRARGRTGAAIRALLGLAPKTRARDSRTAARRTCRSRRCSVGDVLRVRPGEKVPVDGVVIEGRSAVDEVDGHRRADPGREGCRQPGDRRHAQRHRQLHHAGRARRQRHPARADRADGRRGAADARADPAVSPIAIAAWFVPAVVADRRAGVRRLGRLGSRAARSRTAWSTRWRS